MTDLQWPAEVIGRHTVPQLLALTQERAPGAPEPLRSAEAYLAMMAAREAEDRAWSSP